MTKTVQGFVDVAKEPMQLLCVCGNTVFKCIIDPEGVMCLCVSCDRRYRLQSLGGLKVSNA